MLAEGKARTKWCQDPRNTFWSTGESDGSLHSPLPSTHSWFMNLHFISFSKASQSTKRVHLHL